MATIPVGYGDDGSALSDPSYTTTAAAFAAASAGDRLEIYWADTQRGRCFLDLGPNSGAVTTKYVSIVGVRNGLVLMMNSTNLFFYWMQADLTGVGTVTYWENFTLMQYNSATTTKYGMIWINNVGGTGAGLIVRRVRMVGFVNGLRCFDYGKILVYSCYFLGCDIGIRVYTKAEIYHVTTRGCRYGIYLNGADADDTIVKDCAFIMGIAADIYIAAGNTGLDLDYNASRDATAQSTCTGSHYLINQGYSDLDWWDDNPYILAQSDLPGPRILTTSTLYGAGTPISGCETDIDGNAFPTPTNIGCHAGTATPFGITHPVAGDVQTGSGAFISWAGEITPTCDLPAAAGVLSSVSYGAGGVEYTGTWTKADKDYVLTGHDFGNSGSEVAAYSPDFPEPQPIPTLTAEDNGDLTVTFTVAGAGASTTNHIYRQAEGDPSAEDVAQVVGNGDAVVDHATGNYTAYIGSELGGYYVYSPVISYSVIDATAWSVGCAADLIRENGVEATIQDLVLGARDALGSKAQTWTDVGTAYVWVQPLSSAEITDYSKRGLQVQEAGYVAEDPGVGEGARLKIGTRYMRIAGIEDQSGLARVWKLLLSEAQET